MHDNEMNFGSLFLMRRLARGSAQTAMGVRVNSSEGRVLNL